MRPHLAIAWAFITASFFVSAVPAEAQEDEECFFCHSEPSATKTTEDGRVISLYLDPRLYATSLHSPMGCIACHGDIEELPHEAELQVVNCGNCHEEQEVYAKSLHGIALGNGDTDVATCHDCHGTHDIRRSDDPLSLTYRRNLPKTCGQCHSDPYLVKEHMISLAHPSESYIKSVHGRAIIEKGSEEAAVCHDCHGTHDMLPSQDSRSPVNRLNIPSTCGACHAEVTSEFSQSIHGKALAAGIKDAPTCVDCHGEHQIASPDEEASPVSLRQVSKVTCPRCHDDERIMDRYGVATMRQASYMDSYHGMTSAAGSEVVAGCTSCHGTHDILPASEPMSSIHPDNIPTTCAQCHENAGPNFASGAVHIIPTDPGQKVLGYVRLGYIGLIILVIGGMVFHNSLMMARHAFAKLRRERLADITYRRFDRGQRIGHMILAISFIILAASGFALRYPESWWARNIFIGETGLAMRGLVHRISAVILVGVCAVSFVHLVVTGRGRAELRFLRVTWQDFKDGITNVGHALGITPAKPSFDRYSYMEKVEYWGMLWGTIIMIVTGLCMWFVNIFLGVFPKIALDIVALVHLYEAWLAVLTIVVWHIYHVMFEPSKYPMDWSWVTGRITEEELIKHHPLEYARVREKAQDQNEGPGPQSDAKTTSAMEDYSIDETRSKPGVRPEKSK